MKSYLEKMAEKVDPSVFVLMARTATNWCHGTLMNLTDRRTKLREMQKAEGEQSTVDTEAHNMDDDEETQRDRAHELGFQLSGLEMLRRGECFASMRRYCFELADEKGWEDRNKPRGFEDYIASRIKGMASQDITESDIKREMRASLGITADEARQFLVSSKRKQIGLFLERKANWIAEDGSYSTELDPDDALSTLGILDEHRLRTKLLDGLCFEASRIQKAREGYPNWDKLRDQRTLIVLEALKLQDELVEFEKSNSVAIKKALEANPNAAYTQIQEKHRVMLKLARDMRDEDVRLRKEIIREQMAEEAAKKAA